MSNARIRLRRAREALSRAENSVGLRGRLDVEERYSTGGFVPVLLGPQERGQLIRLLVAGTLARRGRRGEHTAGGLGALHGPVDSRLACQLPRGRPTPGWCRRGCSC